MRTQSLLNFSKTRKQKIKRYGKYLASYSETPSNNICVPHWIVWEQNISSSAYHHRQVPHRNDHYNAAQLSKEPFSPIISPLRLLTPWSARSELVCRLKFSGICRAYLTASIVQDLPSNAFRLSQMKICTLGSVLLEKESFQTVKIPLA